MEKQIQKKAEAISQKIYDLRDSVPASDESSWKFLDDTAKAIGEFAAGKPCGANRAPAEVPMSKP